MQSSVRNSMTQTSYDLERGGEYTDGSMLHQSSGKPGYLGEPANLQDVENVVQSRPSMRPSVNPIFSGIPVVSPAGSFEPEPAEADPEHNRFAPCYSPRTT